MVESVEGEDETRRGDDEDGGIREDGIFFLLAESIGFYRVAGMEMVAVITKVKGVNVRAWDERRGVLAFERGMRVFVFRHDGED
ncbi:hypothetical protein Droror1_Dr00000825 [Drosera rotundifolia]